ncbi:MAG: hypothetical protein FP811_03670 [Desulfobacteraceae bacterium]|nr:hypothetical protein [Desulfobacteraceae bacterium]
MFLLACFPAAFFGHDFLHPVKEFPGNERIMNTYVYLAGPAELTIVKRVFQYLVYDTFRDLLAIFSECKTFSVRFSGQLKQRIVAGGIPFKHLSHLRSDYLIRLNKAFSVAFDIDIAQWGKRRVDALLCFFNHPLLCFLG